MEKAKRKPTEKPFKIWKIHDIDLIAKLILAAILALGGFGSILSAKSDSVIGYCVAVPFLLTFIVILSSSLGTDIKAYANGLKIRSLTRHVFINWRDIRLTDFHVREHQISYQEILYKPYFIPQNFREFTVGGRLSWLFTWSYDAPEINMNDFLDIPMKGSMIDFEAFAETEFGSVLKAHAPHLFD